MYTFIIAGVLLQVDVKVKVLSFDEEPVQKDTRNGKMLKRNITVADHTSALCLTTWGHMVQNLDINKSYTIKCLTVRSYADVPFLNTNADTTIKEIEEVGVVSHNKPMKKHPRILGTVTAVEAIRHKTCAACKKTLGQVVHDAPTAQCRMCGMRQRTSFLPDVTYAKMRIQDDANKTYTLTCFSDILDVLFMHLFEQQTAKMSPQQIEEKLLSTDKMTFTINEIDNLVMAIDPNPV